MIGNLLLAIGLSVGIGLNNSFAEEISNYGSTTSTINITTDNFGNNTPVNFLWYFDELYSLPNGYKFLYFDKDLNFYYQNLNDANIGNYGYSIKGWLNSGDNLFGVEYYKSGQLFVSRFYWKVYRFEGVEYNFNTTFLFQFDNPYNNFTVSTINDWNSPLSIIDSQFEYFYTYEISNFMILDDLVFATPFLLRVYDDDLNVDSVPLSVATACVLDNNDYDTGYNTGYQTGYNTGYYEGQQNGYHNGYIDGQNAGQQISQTGFMGLFASLVDTPIRMLYSLFNFDLFGTSMLIIILSTLTAIVVIKILKKFI